MKSTWKQPGIPCGKTNPQGPRTQVNRVLGPKYYNLNGIYLGPWTLRARASALASRLVIWGRPGRPGFVVQVPDGESTGKENGRLNRNPGSCKRIYRD